MSSRAGRASGTVLDEAGLPPKDEAVRGITWLPRIIPKAKAKLRGELPASLMYCCGGDRKFFKAHDILPAEFAVIARLAAPARGPGDRRLGGKAAGFPALKCSKRSASRRHSPLAPPRAAPMSHFTLNVNGQSRDVDVAPETPSLWVLRDSLDLVGTKYGCGIGQCAACTVHVNGAPGRACQTPVSGAVEREDHDHRGPVGGRLPSRPARLVRTRRRPMRLLPGRADHDRRRRCSRATPIRATQDIDGAMAGNLCRCATYLRIRAGIHRAAEIAAAGPGAAK